MEKKGKEAHDLEFHTPVNCPHCAQPFEKPKLDAHVAVCPKKPKTCEFCQLEFAGDVYPAHVSLCGSKTVQCPRCKRYIPKRDWSDHQKIKCEPEPPPVVERPKPNPKPTPAHAVKPTVRPVPAAYV